MFESELRTKSKYVFFEEIKSSKAVVENLRYSLSRRYNEDDQLTWWSVFNFPCPLASPQRSCCTNIGHQIIQMFDGKGTDCNFECSNTSIALKLNVRTRDSCTCVCKTSAGADESRVNMSIDDATLYLGISFN